MTDPQVVVPVIETALALQRQVEALDPGGIDLQGTAEGLDPELEPVRVHDTQETALGAQLGWIRPTRVTPW